MFGELDNLRTNNFYVAKVERFANRLRANNSGLKITSFSNFKG